MVSGEKNVVTLVQRESRCDLYMDFWEGVGKVINEAGKVMDRCMESSMREQHTKLRQINNDSRIPDSKKEELNKEQERRDEIYERYKQRRGL